MYAHEHTTASRRRIALLTFALLLIGLQGVSSAVQAACTDSVLVFGPKKYVKSTSGTWILYDEEPLFTAIPDSLHGWRYVVEIDRGPSNPSACKFVLDGREWVGSSEGCILKKAIYPDSTGDDHYGTIWISGPTSSYFWLKVMRVREPTYRIYGESTFVRTVPISQQTSRLTVSSLAKSPYTLRLYNGDSVGTNRVTNATLHINSTQVLSAADFSSGYATITRTVSLSATDTLITIHNQSAENTRLSFSITATDSTAPVIVLGAPLDSLVTKQSGVWVSGGVGDETKGWIRVNSRLPFRSPGSFLNDSIPLTYGFHTLSIQATNGACLTTTTTRVVAKDTLPPVLSMFRPMAADTSTTASTLSIDGSWSDLTKTTITVDDSVVALGYSGSFSHQYPLDIGSNRICIRATDQVGHVTQIMRIVFRGDPNESAAGSPTPSTLSATGFTPFVDAVKFLYTGGGAVQTGVSGGAIDSLRAAVVRGTVLSRDYGPLRNVIVRVLGHPEYGQTLTRQDGKFDMVVNGGGELTLRFSKADYLEAQRQIEPSINSYLVLDDVAMIGRSARSLAMDLEVPQVFRSRFATDDNGDRQVRVFFPGEMRARITNTGTPADSEFRYVRVRATEYTQGSQGLATMPAALPPSSAYTYCVEFSLDEADSLASIAGTPASTRFTKPVSIYTRNFLSYPVGTRIPLGYYDRSIGKWVGENDAVVLKIVGASGDTALVDTDGNGSADPAALVDSLGLSGLERRVLLAEYGLNGVLWRGRLGHFSSADPNPNAGPPPDELPKGPARIFGLLALLFGPCLSEGSIIECENRVLGERLPVTGTPYTLNYRSFRAPGDAAVRTVHIPLIGDVIPTTLEQVDIRLDVAGKVYTASYPRAQISAGQIVSMTWDGYDVYERRIEGSVNAQVSLGYRYTSTARGGSRGSGAWGNPARNGGTLPVTANRFVPRVNWVRRQITLGVPGTGTDGLGGWTISPHHVFDPKGRGVVYYGSGEVDPGDRVPITRWIYSSDLAGGCGGDDIDNEAVNDVEASAMALAPDGTLYFADDCRGSVYKVGKDGIAHRVAGTGTPGNFNSSFVGGPARSASLRDVDDIALGPDGSLYLVARWTNANSYNLICKVTPDGNIWRVIGDGSFHQYGQGDDGPVSSATTREITAVAVGSDGSLFFAENGTQPDNVGSYHKVRRVGTDGIITTYAGSEWCSSSSDSIRPATSACVGAITDIGVDPQGNLYILEGSHHRLRRVTREGTISTQVSIQNELFSPNAMAFAPDGSIYLANGAGSGSNPLYIYSHGVYRVDPDGNVFQIAGGVATGSFYNGAPVTTVPLTDVSEVAVRADGAYYVATGGRMDLVIQQFATDLGNEWKVPNPDGTEVYFFSKEGRHLRTRDAMTGTLLHWFDYNATFGDLTSIHDADGGTTTIVRHASTRVPEKIQSPDGQETTLTLASGWLKRIVDPSGRVTSVAHSSSGLLDSLTDGNGNRTTLTWGSDGRLNRDTDAGTGYQQLSVDSLLSRVRQVTRSTALARSTKYRSVASDNGALLRTVTAPSGHVFSMDYKLDTRTETTTPDGTLITERIAGEPRFGVVAPIPSSSSIRLPSGLTHTADVTRPYSASTFNPPTTASSSWAEQVLRNGADTVRTEFNLGNKRVTIQRSLARMASITVDTAGRPIAIHVPGIDTLRRAYDTRGRLTELTQGERGWRFIYDGTGRLAVLRDTMDHEIAFEYNGANHVTAQSLPGERTVTFGYDQTGNLTSVTPPGQSPHLFDYTAVNMIDRYRPPGAGLSDSLTDYSYNLDRQLTAIDRPGTGDVSLTFGSTNGRIERVATPSGNTDFSYDGVGRVSSLSAPGGPTLTYTYDGGIPLSEAYAGSVVGTVSVTLDNYFRPTTQSVNGGNGASYSYDRDGLLTQAGALSITRSASNGLVTSTTLANSTIGSVIAYNNYGEPAIVAAVAGQDTLWKAIYSRDAIGRITGITETVNGATTTYVYAYSDTGFLKTVTAGGTVIARYRYDANGNVIQYDAPEDSASALYDQQDRLLRYRNTRYAYSGAGELASTITGSDTTRFTYDPLGNLTKVRFQSGDSLEYVIDGRNRRVARKWNGSVTRKWLYQDQLEPVAELDGSNNLIARYVYGSHSHVPDYMVKGDTTYRIVSDHLGSVRLVINAVSGSVVQRMSYDPYGRLLTDTNPGFQCFGYAGGLWEATTGLVRFGARDYDGVVGRWTSKDPIGFAGADANLYSYCRNDPINLTDAAGLAATGGASLTNCIKVLKDLYVAATLPGQNAAEYWATESVSPDNSPIERAIATGFGVFASLWTPRTALQTVGTLTLAGALRDPSKWHIDGPAARGTRVVQLRYSNTPILRIDYGRYPGSGGVPKLHLHVLPDMNSWHIPLQP